MPAEKRSTLIEDLVLIKTMNLSTEQQRLLAALAVIDHDMYQKNVTFKVTEAIEKIFP